MLNFSHPVHLDISSFANLVEVVSLLRTVIPRPAVVYLYGDLGVGKTTFVQQWLRNEGIVEAITSPTYNIVNEYISGNQRFIHADLYRISEPEELIYLDAREWRECADLIFIEWPEYGGDFIPPATINVQFTLQGDKRTLLWQTAV